MIADFSRLNDEEKTMIRRCTEADFDAIYEIINDAAETYRGIIPADRWHEPYMSREQLKQEVNAGVQFCGFVNVPFSLRGI